MKKTLQAEMTQQQGEIAFRLHEKVITNELERRRLLAENIGTLSSLKANGLYRAILGVCDGSAPWTGYLAQLEVFYSRNEINNLLAIDEKLVKPFHLKWEEIYDIPRSRLYDLTFIKEITNRELVDEWLSKARTLTSLDWNNELRIIKGRKPSDECEHQFQEYEICSDCGFRHKKEIHLQ